MLAVPRRGLEVAGMLMGQSAAPHGAGPSRLALSTSPEPPAGRRPPGPPRRPASGRAAGSAGPCPLMVLADSSAELAPRRIGASPARRSASLTPTSSAARTSSSQSAAHPRPSSKPHPISRTSDMGSAHPTEGVWGPLRCWRREKRSAYDASGAPLARTARRPPTSTMSTGWSTH